MEVYCTFVTLIKLGIFRPTKSRYAQWRRIKKAGEIAAISPENEPSRIIRTDEKQWLQEPVVGLRRTSVKAPIAATANNKMADGSGVTTALVDSQVAVLSDITVVPGLINAFKSTCTCELVV